MKDLRELEQAPLSTQLESINLKETKNIIWREKARSAPLPKSVYVRNLVFILNVAVNRVESKCHRFRLKVPWY